MVNQIKNGFILTKQSRDISTGIKVTLWLKTLQGPVKLEILNEQAVFFVEERQVDSAKQVLLSRNVDVNKITPLGLKTFSQQKVCGLYFDYMRDFYAARSCLKQQNIKCYEDDFRPDERYLMERFITAGINFIGDEKINSNNPFL
ncbi:MAG: DNA polymerase-2, partial [Alteromonadaceae bacterium]